MRAHKRGKGTQSTAPVTFPNTWSIDVRGANLQVANSARVLHVRAETSTIKSLAELWKQYSDAAKPALTPERSVAPPAAVADDDMDHNIEGKVLWLSAPRGWMVIYTNQKGARTTKSGSEFRVPLAHPTGIPLSQLEFRKMRHDIFLKCIEPWNALEQSLAPRL